jgi:hypothetical protein
LHSGQGKNKDKPPKGKIVMTREQAIAIALSEAKKKFGARIPANKLKESITEKAYRVLIGKRGGKYYLTKTGKKKYGNPPALMKEDRATRQGALKKYLESATPEQIAKTRTTLEGKLADARAKGDKEAIIKHRAGLAVLPKDKKPTVDNWADKTNANIDKLISSPLPKNKKAMQEEYDLVSGLGRDTVRELSNIDMQIRTEQGKKKKTDLGKIADLQKSYDDAFERSGKFGTRAGELRKALESASNEPDLPKDKKPTSPKRTPSDIAKGIVTKYPSGKPKLPDSKTPALNDLKQGEHANMGTIEGIAPNGENRKIAWRTRLATPQEEIQFKRYAPNDEFNKSIFVMERQTNGGEWQTDFAGNQADTEASFQNSVNNLSSRFDNAKTDIKYDLTSATTRQAQAKKVAETTKRKNGLEKQVKDLQETFASDFKRAQSGYGLKFEEALKKNKLWAEFKKNGANSPKFPQIKEALAKEFNAYKKETDAKIAKAQDELKGLEQELASTTKETATFTVFKETSTGKYRWLTCSSTAYRDRDGEIVTTKALEDAVNQMNATGDYGTLRFWHMPSIDLGKCDTSMLIGRAVVESGTFYDNNVALSFKNYQEPLGTSLGFKHTKDQPDASGHYHKIHVFERSVLPFGKASNLFTRFAVS